MGQNTVSAFTTGPSDRIERSLRNMARVSMMDKAAHVPAVWDTGATCSCVSEQVVKELGLIPTGKTQVLTPGGAATLNTYLVDITLPNNVTIPDVQVCDSEIGKQGVGLLVGMDIIALGDFAVSNYNGRTTFSFRIPSQGYTDYAKQLRTRAVMGPPHGNGKRKKR